MEPPTFLWKMMLTKLVRLEDMDLSYFILTGGSIFLLSISGAFSSSSPPAQSSPKADDQLLEKVAQVKRPRLNGPGTCFLIKWRGFKPSTPPFP